MRKKSPLKNIRNLFDNLWDGMYLVDRDQKIIYWNRAATELTGYSPGEVIGKSCGHDLLSHHVASTILCAVSCPLKQTLIDGQIREAQVSLTHKNGHSIPVFVRTLPYYNQEGQIAGAIELFRQVAGFDEITTLLHELHNLAHVDPLTKTARRAYGEEVLDKALDSFKTFNSSFGLLLIDLDLFKEINDNYGHLAGDHVLLSVAERIHANLRASDMLVRWGGDEFLLVSSGANTAMLEQLGNKLCALIAEMRLQWDNVTLSITLSIGGAMPEKGDTRISLLDRADKNLYISKHQGRNRCTL